VSATVIRSEPDQGFSVSFIESERGQVNTFLSALWRMQQQKTSSAAGTELHPARLYVCGVPPQLNDQRLEELFARYGSLQKLRLVKTVQGLIAQVDMLSSDEARHARMALDQLKLHGAILDVVPAESAKGRELRSLLESSGPETFGLRLR
jgi:RNA recognition motif-containing protein